ncbi:uncharacterized protein M421DRAFT_92946 [Didymella exigua CBS 183.55]|uniref:Uncharacterized protein n=1 Tax=Didymella exigua CBS 183.55 TaxID=1150837 RepID=A0A6A5RGS3_9PLEO|nr:uncharacterized protein M421DRAFT_92946 [Didymella exigua CBS 183.55]KAF1927515.1 hypothetical protein M421DRAFT_92946 [Didymella exigua CBS 183.55]
MSTLVRDDKLLLYKPPESNQYFRFRCCICSLNHISIAGCPTYACNPDPVAIRWLQDHQSVAEDRVELCGPTFNVGNKLVVIRKAVAARVLKNTITAHLECLFSRKQVGEREELTNLINGGSYGGFHTMAVACMIFLCLYEDALHLWARSSDPVLERTANQ